MTHGVVAARLVCAIFVLASVGVAALAGSPVRAATPSPAAAASACSISSNPSMVEMGAGAGQAGSVADVIEVGCLPVYAGSAVTIDASQLDNHCHATLSWSRPFPYAPAPGPQFTVRLDGDGNATAVAWAGPLCAAGAVSVSATLDAPPFPAVSTSFTIVPPSNSQPGVSAHPSSEVEDAMWSSAATVVEVAFPASQAGRTVNVQSHELLTRCADGLTWVGPDGTFLGSGVDGVTVTLDNNGNAFAVALAGPSCASGTSTIEASLTTAPYTTYVGQFTILSPRPTYWPSSITTAPSNAGGAPVGTALTDSAQVTGHSPTGLVTFHLFGPDNPTCDAAAIAGASQPWLATWRTTLDSGHAAVPPPGYTTTRPGTYRWVADYSGDGNNQPSESGCNKEVVAVTTATPVIATSASDGGPVGVSIHDSATVSGGYLPQGSVTFDLYPPSDPTCAHSADIVQSVTEPLHAGSATTAAQPFMTDVAGTYHWIAIYNADPNNSTVTTACADEPVVTGTAATSISTQPSSGGGVGMVIADSATVTGGTAPSGTVTFTLHGPDDPNCAAAALYTSTTRLSHGVAVSGGFGGTTVPGTYTWSALYTDDAGNPGARSDCVEQVIITAPAITSAGGGPSLSTPSTSADVPLGTALALINLGSLLCLAAAPRPARRRASHSHPPAKSRA